MRIIMACMQCHCSEDKLIYTCSGTGMMLTAFFNIVIDYLPSLELRESCGKGYLLLKTMLCWSTVSRETKRQKMGIYLYLHKWDDQPSRPCCTWHCQQEDTRDMAPLHCCLAVDVLCCLKKWCFLDMVHSSPWLLLLFDHKKMNSDFKSSFLNRF